MRGFPLLNLLLVAGAFSVAWWPFHQLADHSQVFDAGAEQELVQISPAQEPLWIRIVSSQPLTHLLIEHLGETVVDEAGEFDEWESEIDPIKIPAEGIEFWVEAKCATRDADAKIAVGIELAPGDREPLTQTLWGNGDSAADSVVFVWDKQ